MGSMMQKIQRKLEKFKKSPYRIITISMLLLIIAANLFAFSKSFCNTYADRVYPRIADFFGKLTNVLPLPLGEICLYIGSVMLILAVLFSVLLIRLRKNQKFVRFTKKYLRSVLFAFVFILLLYSFQWIIPFRSDLLGESGHNEKQYSVKELRLLWLYVVGNLNERCKEVERDDEGRILYPDKETTEKEVCAAMRAISGTYPRLKGFYPDIKPAICSDFLNWMQIGGFTYPYTMEVTYNKYTSDLYFPSLYAHESAHHKGYYQENEANFLSFLACAESGEPILRYSAYHEIYYYIDDAYRSSLSGGETALLREYENTPVDDQVWLDEQAEAEKMAEVYDADDHPFEGYAELAEDVADVGWDTQGELLAENSYDGVVQLLLEYYDGILY